MTYLGLRPGEKLYEELLVKTEELDKTENSMIFIERDTALKVFYINYGLHAKNTKTVKPTSLEEFLGLIKHAATVFTASYHGMLFSLYYNKRFYFYTRAHSSRVLSLAKILGVQERLGDSGIVDTDIDYSIVNQSIGFIEVRNVQENTAIIQKK